MFYPLACKSDTKEVSRVEGQAEKSPKDMSIEHSCLDAYSLELVSVAVKRLE